MDERYLLAFYGDDFTESADAMEAMAINGFRTVLFLEPPTEEQLKQFPGVQCIGVAGTARAKAREEMEEELRPIFQRLQELNPFFVHYKVCSTFDSSERLGSIGFAADLAREFWDHDPYPLLAAVPQLGRYTVFGHHFATMEGRAYRLDRHPVMSRHPSTPMRESDLTLHLSAQTAQSISLIDVLDLAQGEERIHERLRQAEQSGRPAIVLFDALHEDHLQRFAEAVWRQRGDRARFMIGSSGVEYALAKMWAGERRNRGGELEHQVGKAERMLVVSGSVSEITSRQMQDALAKGFHRVRVPYRYFGTNEVPAEYLDTIAAMLRDKNKVIMYTSDGPEDSAIEQTRSHLAALGIRPEHFAEVIGRDLGRWTRLIMEQSNVRRLVVAGGDTSGFVTRELGIYALEVLAAISPGAPLCKAYAPGNAAAVEIALKGGQLGGADYYERVAAGIPGRSL